MTSPILSKIYVPSIPPMGFPDRPPKAFLRIRNGDKMNMLCEAPDYVKLRVWASAYTFYTAYPTNVQSRVALGY